MFSLSLRTVLYNWQGKLSLISHSFFSNFKSVSTMSFSRSTLLTSTSRKCLLVLGYCSKTIAKRLDICLSLKAGYYITTLSLNNIISVFIPFSLAPWPSLRSQSKQITDWWMSLYSCTLDEEWLLQQDQGTRQLGNKDSDSPALPPLQPVSLVLLVFCIIEPGCYCPLRKVTTSQDRHTHYIQFLHSWKIISSQAV